MQAGTTWRPSGGPAVLAPGIPGAGHAVTKPALQACASSSSWRAQLIERHGVARMSTASPAWHKPSRGCPAPSVPISHFQPGYSRPATATGAAAGRSGPSATQGSAPDVERSMLVHEELVIFMFQLDLDVQLQRALNYEAYEQAQKIRAKRQQVDEALESLKARKSGTSGSADKGLSAGDIAAEGLRLRTAMQRAVEAEDYKEAAALRDMLAALQQQAARSEALTSLMSGQVTPRLRLGQRVWHRLHAYRGVVVGWDAQCCEGEEWLQAQQDAAAASGRAAPQPKQPHYHLLVDQRDWAYNLHESPVAYVAEELLWAPEQGGNMPEEVWGRALRGDVECGLLGEDTRQGPGQGMAPKAPPPAVSRDSSWASVFGRDDELEHPYGYLLFLGQDAKGDYLPCRQLRDKYRVARRDVYADGEGEDEQETERDK